MGHMVNGGNGVQGVWVTWAMGPMGNVDTGGNGEQGIWGTWAMSPTGAKWYRGSGTGKQGPMGYGPRDNEAHRGYGVQEYGPPGQ